MASPAQLQAQLQDLLLLGHRHAENPELQPLQRAAVTRQLYSCILSQPHWRAAFDPEYGVAGPSSPTGVVAGSSSTLPTPSWDNLSEWLVPTTEGFGPEQTWSLLQVQRQAEERRRKAGKLARRPKPGGSVCGKVLQRFDRTYICK